MLRDRLQICLHDVVQKLPQHYEHDAYPRYLIAVVCWHAWWSRTVLVPSREH